MSNDNDEEKEESGSSWNNLLCKGVVEEHIDSIDKHGSPAKKKLSQEAMTRIKGQVRSVRECLTAEELHVHDTIDDLVARNQNCLYRHSRMETEQSIAGNILALFTPPANNREPGSEENERSVECYVQ
eukprot:TRINITY_DN1131_c0_g1_i10.p1 TRINITY_DN1131_c0_g1~~TRINITY_DN1131_c0_g1_i10.p1  ORF type:complete len:128 (+),score=38.21 TRINITY_DN1131_c0_g1_i10:458-841(+)